MFATKVSKTDYSSFCIEMSALLQSFFKIENKSLDFITCLMNYEKATYSRTTKPRKDNLSSIQRSQTVQRELQKDQKKIFS